jgi:hypothetical protein
MTADEVLALQLTCACRASRVVLSTAAQLWRDDAVERLDHPAAAQAGSPDSRSFAAWRTP